MLGNHKNLQEKLEEERKPKKKPISFLYGMLAIMLVVVISLTSCVVTPTSTSSTNKDITVDEAQQLIGENGNLIILDVRTQAEYDSGHIPNAILIPVGELSDRLGELDKAKTILVYCQSGVRSAQASQILVDSSFSQVCNLEGGIIALQEAGGAINHPPIIESLTTEKAEVTKSTVCDIECIASDPDGDELSYEWSTEGGGISGKGSTVTWTAPDVVGTYNITVVVTDGQGGESRSSLNINVAVNHPPIIEDLIITPEDPKDFKRKAKEMRIYKGGSCDIECIASDPDGDELSYQWSADQASWWPAVGSISGQGSVVTWTAPLETSRVIVTVIVSDGKGGTDTESTDTFVVVTSYCALR